MYVKVPDVANVSAPSIAKLVIRNQWNFYRLSRRYSEMILLKVITLFWKTQVPQKAEVKGVTTQASDPQIR